MKKILVTGGAGFIGSNFCNINKEKYNITVLDNLLLGDKDNLDQHENINFIKGDACLLEDLQKCGDQFDYVLHLAGSSTAPMFIGDGFVKSYINSVTSFAQTLEFARLAGAKKFFYASTSSLYGNNPTPLVEDQNVIPPNHYAVTKFLYEHCSRCYNKIYPHLEIVGFRFMSIYGPNEEAKGQFANVVSQFIWDIMRGNQPIIYGDGSQTRDFTSVHDVVQGLNLALESNEFLGNDIFNIGTGEYFSLNEIIKEINQEVANQGGNTIEPEYIPNPVKENYMQSQHADISKISSKLGFKPTVNLKKGIKEQITNIRYNKIKKTSSDIWKENR